MHGFGGSNLSIRPRGHDSIALHIQSTRRGCTGSTPVLDIVVSPVDPRASITITGSGLKHRCNVCVLPVGCEYPVCVRRPTFALFKSDLVHL